MNSAITQGRTSVSPARKGVVWNASYLADQLASHSIAKMRKIAGLNDEGIGAANHRCSVVVGDWLRLPEQQVTSHFRNIVVSAAIILDGDAIDGDAHSHCTVSRLLQRQAAIVGTVARDVDHPASSLPWCPSKNASREVDTARD